MFMIKKIKPIIVFIWNVRIQRDHLNTFLIEKLYKGDFLIKNQKSIFRLAMVWMYNINCFFSCI